MKARTALLGTAAVLVGGSSGLVLSPAAARAASQDHQKDVTMPFPWAALNPFFGPALTIPPNCPFGGDATISITGNFQQHGTSNHDGNADWGGQTGEGIATLTDGDSVWSGQATFWGGGGNNSTGQGEEGETFHFNGVSVPGGATLDVHVSYHATINNNGTVTNMNESVVCTGTSTIPTT